MNRAHVIDNWIISADISTAYQLPCKSIHQIRHTHKRNFIQYILMIEFANLDENFLLYYEHAVPG